MTTMRRKTAGIFLDLAIIAMSLSLPTIVSAHAFAEPFVVPVPLSLYFIGSSVALIASFCFFYLFSRPASKIRSAIVITLRPSLLVIATRGIVWLGICFLGLTILTGIFGGPDFNTNPAPSLFWDALILAVAYLSIFIDGIWSIANPFRSISRVIVASRQPLLRYPKQLGCLPALALYYGLIWLELFSNGAGGSPILITCLLAGYLTFSIIGSILFGIADWFEYGDFFSVFFGTIGLFASIKMTEQNIELHQPFTRLSEKGATDLMQTLFILLILATTAFDGFVGTQTWSEIVYANSVTTALAPQLGYLLFALSLPIFFGFYCAVIWLMQKITHSSKSLRHLLLRFSYSLIPIAVGYNIAHYFTWFLNQGLHLLILLGDPFNRGWNLLGTKTWLIHTIPLNRDIVWYIEVTVIVGAHIIATYVAHQIALYEFKSRRIAFISQLPVLILMIGYTLLGLWILSQPVGSLS